MYKTFLISTLFAGAALGQTTTAGVAGPPPLMLALNDMADAGAIHVETSLAARIETVTGAPYSAQTVTERIQTLPDGNRIVESVSGSIARDKQGRLRREESLPGLGPGNGPAPQIVMIDDPVAQVHWSLDVAGKTAVKMPTGGLMTKHLAEAKAGGAVPAEPMIFFSKTINGSPEPGMMGPPEMGRIEIFNHKTGAEAEVKRTELGMQNMEGVMVKGTRTERTIAAGEIGNEMPILITSESWYSPELKVIVMSKSSDPRMGETKYKLTGIQRADPAPALFQVPDDYTVRDRFTDNLHFMTPRN